MWWQSFFHPRCSEPEREEKISWRPLLAHASTNPVKIHLNLDGNIKKQPPCQNIFTAFLRQRTFDWHYVYSASERHKKNKNGTSLQLLSSQTLEVSLPFHIKQSDSLMTFKSNQNQNQNLKNHPFRLAYSLWLDPYTTLWGCWQVLLFFWHCF